LRVLDPTWDPMQKLWQEKIIPQFEAMHPNVSIQYEWVEWGPILREKAVLAHTSGAPYDVFMIPDWYMPGLVKLGVLSPVEPKYFGARSVKEIKDRYVEGALDRMVMYEGKLYAIPVEMSAHVYIYNPRHFEEIGRAADDAPKTFEEMLDIAKKLTKRDSSGALIRSGFYPNVYPGSNAGFMMVGPQIVQLGGRYFDETWTTPSFVTPEAIKAYTLFQDLFMPDKIGCAELGFAIDENQMGADFVSGRVSQIYGGAYMNSIFEGIDPDFKDYVYAPIPPLKDAKQKAVAVWGAIYCVDTASKNQDLAWELVNFMSEEQFAAIWMLECGMYTALKGDWLNDVLAQMPEGDVRCD
jgi:multiple sugar transport system substrate-binding protein